MRNSTAREIHLWQGPGRTCRIQDLEAQSHGAHGVSLTLLSKSGGRFGRESCGLDQTECFIFRSQAYHRGPWLRKLAKFGIDGFTYSQDFYRYDRFVAEWDLFFGASGLWVLVEAQVGMARRRLMLGRMVVMLLVDGLGWEDMD